MACRCTTDPALRERCFGGFEGLLYDEIEARFPEAFAQWRARDPHARYPDGERRAETFAEFTQRAVGAYPGCRAHRGKRIAMVAMAACSTASTAPRTAWTSAAPRDFKVLNASINRFRWDGERLAAVALVRRQPSAAALDELGN